VALTCGKMRHDATQIIEDYWGARPSDQEIRTFDLRPFPAGGHNVKFRATSATGTWIIKFCRHDDQRVPEVCRREAMASLFGRIVSVPVVDAWVLPADLIERHRPEQDGQLILDEFVLMREVKGKAFEENRLAGAARIGMQAESVGDVLAFMHWIGDEDRGLADVMYEGNNFLLIDNGLCGPGNNPKLRGYHPDPNAFSHDRVIMKCYGGGKQSFVEFIIKEVEFNVQRLQEPAVLRRIGGLDDGVVKEVVERLGIDVPVAKTLIERRSTIAADYDSWLAEAVEFRRSVGSNTERGHNIKAP